MSKKLVTAALFDFDKTITKKDTTAQFLLYVLCSTPRALVEIPQLSLHTALYAWKLISKERLKSKALRIFTHILKEKRSEVLQCFHDEKLIPRYLPRALERINWHKSQKHRLILVSASIDLYLAKVIDFLEFDTLICTRTQLEPTPRVIGPNCYGQEKVNRLKKQEWFEEVDWRASWAYSDHISDLPMLTLCGHPTVINPKAQLRKYATRQKWEVINWY